MTEIHFIQWASMLYPLWIASIIIWFAITPTFEKWEYQKECRDKYLKPPELWREIDYSDTAGRTPILEEGFTITCTSVTLDDL